MNKKIKHRVVGILTIIGLIAISLPFFQHQHIQSDINLAKAPPFPEPAPVAVLPVADPVFSPPVENKISPEAEKPDEITPASFNNKHVIITGTSLSQPKTHSALSAKTIHPVVPSTVPIDRLIGSKNTAWAIQLGSFRDKKNALRLVNHLRENGYRAFMRQISTSFGENTRVYVGPELKNNLVTKLALQLENDLHIKGMIVRYHPLDV